jgi:hypothetical protein
LAPCDEPHRIIRRGNRDDGLLLSLIFREESELQAAQGQANRANGFRAGSWYWGFALGSWRLHPEAAFILPDPGDKPRSVLGILASAIAKKANAWQ